MVDGRDKNGGDYSPSPENHETENFLRLCHIFMRPVGELTTENGLKVDYKILNELNKAKDNVTSAYLALSPNLKGENTKAFKLYKNFRQSVEIWYKVEAVLKNQYNLPHDKKTKIVVGVELVRDKAGHVLNVDVKIKSQKNDVK